VIQDLCSFVVKKHKHCHCSITEFWLFLVKTSNNLDVNTAQNLARKRRSRIALVEVSKPVYELVF